MDILTEKTKPLMSFSYSKLHYIHLMTKTKKNNKWSIRKIRNLKGFIFLANEMASRQENNYDNVLERIQDYVA